VEAGALATEEALKQFDTNGEPIEIEGRLRRSKGQADKRFQTPYGEIQCGRHVYHYQGRGKTFCPLDAGCTHYWHSDSPLCQTSEYQNGQ
jgi:hypothetical protein